MSGRGETLARGAMQVLGVAAIAFGVFADMVGVGGSPGMGLKQWLIVAAGAALLLAGRTTRASFARRVERVRAWAADDAGVMGPGRLVLFGVTVGLVTGLLETLILGTHRFALNGLVRVGPHIVWMTPLINAAILAVVAGLLWVGSRAWPKLATPSVAGVLMFVLSADALLHRIRAHGQVSAEAKWVLVIGIAVALGRPAAKRWSAARGPVWRPAVATAAVVAVLGAAVAVNPVWKERRALASLPGADANRPNLIFIILDTVRAASLSVYGYERPTTRELERFAAEGVVFEQAISPSSWTLPSHGSMFTGRHGGELGVDWFTPLDDTFPTVAERLSAAGYATAGFSANVGYVSVEAGLSRGFARFEDFVPTAGEAVRTSKLLERLLTPFGLEKLVTHDNRGRRTAEDINLTFLAWLDRRPQERPYFAFLNYFDAHAPFYAPPPFDTLYGGRRRLKPWGPNLTEQEVAAWIDAYDRSLVYLDAQLGVLFRELERRGELENTVVIVSSDHGEHLGENSFMGHATTLYRPAVEVPLIVRGRDIPAGVRIGERVGLRDMAATLLDLAGVSGGDGLPGASLATAWVDGRQDEPVYSELGTGARIPLHYPNAQHDLWSIYESDLHYIVSTSGEEELYRITTDPGEETNLLERDPEPDEAAVLRVLLRRHLDGTGRSDALRTAGH